MLLKMYLKSMEAFKNTFLVVRVLRKRETFNSTQIFIYYFTKQKIIS